MLYIPGTAYLSLTNPKRHGYGNAGTVNGRISTFTAPELQAPQPNSQGPVNSVSCTTTSFCPRSTQPFKEHFPLRGAYVVCVIFAGLVFKGVDSFVEMYTLSWNRNPVWTVTTFCDEISKTSHGVWNVSVLGILAGLESIQGWRQKGLQLVCIFFTFFRGEKKRNLALGLLDWSSGIDIHIV